MIVYLWNDIVDPKLISILITYRYTARKHFFRLTSNLHEARPIDTFGLDKYNNYFVHTILLEYHPQHMILLDRQSDTDI